MKNPELHQAVDCGELNNDKSKRNKVTSKIMIIFAAVAAVICAIVIVCTQIFSPINRLNRLFDKQDYSAVSDFLSQNESNEEIQSAGHILYEQAVRDVLFNYGSDMISKKDANQKLNDLSILGDVTEAKMTLDLINRSRNTYNSAEEKFDKEDYVSAFLKYKDISELDIKNYNSAAQKMELCRIKYNENAMGKADKLIANNEYIEAYLYLDGLEKELVSQTVLDKTEDIKDVAVGKALSYSEALVAEGKYTEAVDFLEPLVRIDSQIYNTHREYKRAYYTNLISESKSAVSVVYDEMEKKYLIAPKGCQVSYLNISYSRNIEAKLLVKSGQAMFALYTGFQQNDWIFMDSILFDCDGKQFKWQLDYFDRESKVLFGAGIAEWYIAYDGSSLSGYISGMKDLKPLVTAMGQAETVKIRFKGEGTKDVVVPQSHIKEIIAVWNIYQALDFDVSLVHQL